MITGIVPVTLVNERRAEYPHVDQRQSSATHAEYSGLVLFRNTFDGELPAVEYPKINVSQFRNDDGTRQSADFGSFTYS